MLDCMVHAEPVIASNMYMGDHAAPSRGTTTKWDRRVTVRVFIQVRG